MLTEFHEVRIQLVFRNLASKGHTQLKLKRLDDLEKKVLGVEKKQVSPFPNACLLFQWTLRPPMKLVDGVNVESSSPLRR